MKFILGILLTALFSFIAGLFLPWWSLAIIAFLVAFLLKQGLGRSFLAGFLGILLLWGLLAFWIDLENGSLLSKKIAALFSLGESSIALVLITAFIGALVAGFAAMSGSALHPAPNRRA